MRFPMSARQATGWYGIPGGPGYKSTKVHVVTQDGPLCGSKVGSQMEFQWCSWELGVTLGYIECKRCLVQTRGERC